jgi:hypothetical protein
MQQPKLDELIAQISNVLARGRDHSAKDQSKKALRCFAVAPQLTAEIKRQELNRAWADAGQLQQAQAMEAAE